MSIIQPFPRNIIILLVPLFDSMAVFDSRRMISMAMLMGGSLVSSVVATSHVMVSLGGSHYEHGNKVAMTQPSRSSLPPMAMNSGVDMMEPPMDSMEQPMKMAMKSMPMELMAMEPAMPMEPMDNHRVGPSVAPHLFTVVSIFIIPRAGFLQLQWSTPIIILKQFTPTFMCRCTLLT